MGLASRLPRADRTPAGIVTVTRVDGLNGTAGVNISVSPVACQLPGTLGLMAGRGDPADTGAEKVTWTGSLPSAWGAPGAGVMEITRNGPGRVTPGLIGALGGMLPPPCVSTYVPAPAISATVAEPIAITRGRDCRATPVPNLAPVANACLRRSPPIDNTCSPFPGTIAHSALSVTNGPITAPQRHERAYPTRRAITHGLRKRKVGRRRPGRIPRPLRPRRAPPASRAPRATAQG